MLIKKAVAVRKHLERNKKDKDSKFRLILIESRIHRCVLHTAQYCYTLSNCGVSCVDYRDTTALPESWTPTGSTSPPPPPPWWLKQCCFCLV
jgi:hypothetical protein